MNIDLCSSTGREGGDKTGGSGQAVDVCDRLSQRILKPFWKEHESTGGARGDLFLRTRTLGDELSASEASKLFGKGEWHLAPAVYQRAARALRLPAGITGLVASHRARHRGALAKALAGAATLDGASLPERWATLDAGEAAYAEDNLGEALEAGVAVAAAARIEGRPAWTVDRMRAWVLLARVALRHQIVAPEDVLAVLCVATRPPPGDAAEPPAYRQFVSLDGARAIAWAYRRMLRPTEALAVLQAHSPEGSALPPEVAADLHLRWVYERSTTLSALHGESQKAERAAANLDALTRWEAAPGRARSEAARLAADTAIDLAELGRLPDADAALKRARSLGGATSAARAVLAAADGTLALARGDLAAAEAHAITCLSESEKAGVPEWTGYGWELRIRRAKDAMDHAAADAHTQELEQFRRRAPSLEMR